MSLDISVVTPSYNQGKFIERTLQSVLSQPLPFEYVVVDGGSTDETLAVLKKINDPRLRWVSEPDRGQAHAVNKGIAATQGEIIAWLNSDDIYYPGTLEKVRQYFADHEGVDVLYGDAFHIDVEDNHIEPYVTEPWDFERMKSMCFMSQPAVFFRRRVVERFGMLDESLQYCMDYEYWLRLGKGGAAFAYMPEPLAGSRMYDQNKTLSQRIPVHAEINQMMRKKFGKVPSKWVFNYAHVKVDEQRQRGFWWVILISWQSIMSSLQWNHEVSKEIFITIGVWLRDGVRKLRQPNFFDFKSTIKGYTNHGTRK